MRTLKEILRGIKMRILPPSSRSFHFTFQELFGNIQELLQNIRLLNKKSDRNISLTQTRNKYNEVMSYILLHKEMEACLRQKVRRGEKVRVFFLIQYMAKFECKSVYDAMEKNSLFEPYVLITHPRDTLFLEEPSYIEEVKKSYQIMIQRGYRTVLGYDEQWRPIQLENLHPDIIFWNNPNMFHRSHYQNIYLNANYLTCFVPYFFNTANLEDRSRYLYSCEHYQCITSWKIFVESYPAFYQMTEKQEPIRSERPMEWIGINAVLSGYPKLDAYVTQNTTYEIPKKINNGNPIVIYAPHWSIHTDTKLSTFHLFNQQFLQLAHQNPGINFVFKPHPDLHNRIIDLYNAGREDTMTPEEYDMYIKEWESLPNGILIDDGEYIGLFCASTCLITDCGSFIAEYLPSGHPCIYLLNPEKEFPLDFYSEFGRKVVESYYCCSDWESIEEYFKQVVLEGKDPNKEQRQQIVKESYLNIGTAGEFICEYIENQLRK